MPMGDLLPCPFCGCTTVRSFHVFGSGRYRVDCNACNGGFEANDPERAIALWNRRSDRAGLIAGLREAEALTETEPEMPGDTPHYVLEAMEAAGPVTNARSACRATKTSILARIRARIAALETEEGKS